MYVEYKNFLANLARQFKLRKLSHDFLSKDNVIDFSTNDYLNLHKSERLIEAAKDAAYEYGVGATGSRLLSGNNALSNKFEEQIAADKLAEASLLFNSGFQANVSTLACLLDKSVLKAQPLVFFDRLNHASLYQAVFLSGAELCRYQHNDMVHLQLLLTKYKSSPRPKFIVSETVFGMDGDIAPLNELVRLAKEFSAFLYLDEAHDVGVLGKRGYGLSTELALQDINYMIMGTFSKALGGIGAYIVGSKDLIEYVINKGGGFIFSTAASPMSVGAAQAAWHMVAQLDKERELLQDLATNARCMLESAGFDIGSSKTHIIPILIGEEEKSLQLQKSLKEHNIIVSAIRPPTVPPKTSRLRLALNISHQLSDVAKLINVLQREFV